MRLFLEVSSRSESYEVLRAQFWNLSLCHRRKNNKGVWENINLRGISEDFVFIAGTWYSRDRLLLSSLQRVGGGDASKPGAAAEMARGVLHFHPSLCPSTGGKMPFSGLKISHHTRHSWQRSHPSVSQPWAAISVINCTLLWTFQTSWHLREMCPPTVSQRYWIQAAY